MATTTTTTTLTIQPGHSHGSTGQTGPRPPSVAPDGQSHDSQQANTFSSTTPAIQTIPSPGPRPASPSSSTGVSSTLPTVRIARTKIRHCWEIVQTIAAWVAIAFTIGSFVRDYLDITKDRPISPQEAWELQNAFRLSCEYDRRAELRSEACDLALSKPASPPPGISKRALHERSMLHDTELEHYIFYGIWALLILAAIVVSRSIDKFTGQSREEQQPDTCSCKPSSTSAEEEQQLHEIQTNPSAPPPNPPCQEDDGTYPTSRANNLIAIVIFAVLIAPVFLVYRLVTDERLMLDSYQSKLSAGIYFGSTLILMVLLSFLTTANLHEILAAAAAYCAVLAAFCGWAQ